MKRLSGQRIVAVGLRFFTAKVHWIVILLNIKGRTWRCVLLKCWMHHGVRSPFIFISHKCFDFELQTNVAGADGEPEMETEIPSIVASM